MLFSPKPPKNPPEINWNRRAVPREGAEDKYRFGTFGWGREIDRIARGNIAYLLAKAAAQGNIIYGYHGTTSENAANIAKKGFENRLNEEGHAAVSLWDEAAPLRAIEFARRRSQESGAEDHGCIILARTVEPFADLKFGRLEWLADAQKTTALEVYTPEELRERLGEIPSGNIHYRHAA